MRFLQSRLERGFLFACVSFLLGITSGPAQATPFATDWLSYTPGSDTNPDFRDPNTALGKPALESGFGDITPFAGAFTGDLLVQVGSGGELVVGFDHAVMDDPLNPFGVDLLVFGNAFFFNPDFTGPTLALDIFADAGAISLSQDGATWLPVTGTTVDGLFPTQAYINSSGPYADDGTIEADFTRPVAPSADWMGKTFEEIVALYAGSGGGAGVDISEVGLPWIQFVKISVPADVVMLVEIDAFSDVAVPEPGSLFLLPTGLVALGLLRRLRSSGLPRA
jgi:hypothetical protein